MQVAVTVAVRMLAGVLVLPLVDNRARGLRMVCICGGSAQGIPTILGAPSVVRSWRMVVVEAPPSLLVAVGAVLAGNVP